MRDAITFATGKSRGRREAIIPLYDELRDVLACIPKRCRLGYANAAANFRAGASLARRSITSSSAGSCSPACSTTANGAVQQTRAAWPWAQELDLRRLRRNGRRAAAIDSLIQTAKVNDIDPQTWLAGVLARQPDHPAKAD